MFGWVEMGTPCTQTQRQARVPTSSVQGQIHDQQELETLWAFVLKISHSLAKASGEQDSGNSTALAIHNTMSGGCPVSIFPGQARGCYSNVGHHIRITFFAWW